MLLALFLVGCDNEIDSLLKNPSETEDNISSMTRSALADSIDKGELVEFEPDQAMLKLKGMYDEMHSSQKRVAITTPPAYDETLWSNMWAIREIPSTIKVKSKATSGSKDNYITLFCDGKGQEVSLNSGNDRKKNRFYIKVLPASTGIPYLIYSTASQTPLTVGYYTKKPDEKILMAASDNSSSSIGLGWDLLQASNKKYYAIQSQSYLGQSDPNVIGSIFYYVLEAVSGDKIRYAQRVNGKEQQEFVITPDSTFKIISLEYDVTNYKAQSSFITKTVTVANEHEYEKMMDAAFNFIERETSSFSNSSWNVNLNFKNPTIKFKRPTVVKGTVISPTTDAPEDAIFITPNNIRQGINRKIVYNCPIRCKARSIAKVTTSFVRYDVTVNYTAKVQCEITEGDLRECILKGTWNGYIFEDPNKYTPQTSVVFTPIDGGDIIL